MNNLLTYAQLFDASFPNGSFAYSNGLESHLRRNHRSADDVAGLIFEFTLEYLNAAVIEGELPLFFEIYRRRAKDSSMATKSTNSNWLHNVTEFAELVRASLPTSAQREEFDEIGRRTLDLTLELWPNELLGAYHQSVNEGKATPWVWGIASGIESPQPNPPVDIATLGSYAMIRTMIINAQRIIPFGQKSAQVLIAQLARKIPALISKSQNISWRDSLATSLLLEYSNYVHTTLSDALFRT